MKRETIEIVENWIMKGNTGKISINFFKGTIVSTQEEETHRTIKILTQRTKKDKV